MVQDKIETESAPQRESDPKKVYSARALRADWDHRYGWYEAQWEGTKTSRS